MRSLAVLSVSVLGLLLTPVAAMSQVAGRSDATRARTLDEMSAGTRLRWRTPTLHGEGSLLARAGDTVLFRVGGDTTSLPITAVDSLWTGHDARRTGAIIGLLVGATPVAIVCGDTLDECGLIPNGLLLIAFSTALGAAVGTQIGSWRLVWP